MNFFGNVFNKALPLVVAGWLFVVSPALASAANANDAAIAAALLANQSNAERQRGLRTPNNVQTRNRMALSAAPTQMPASVGTPNYSGMFSGYFETANLTFWRETINNRERLLVKVESPASSSTTGFFFCPGGHQFSVIQNGVDYGNAFRATRGDDIAVCEHLHASEIFLVDQWSIYTNFVEAGAFVISYRAIYSGSINVPASAGISDDRVFAFAEANYPTLFSGTPVEGQYFQYHYRYYPGSGNYLAVDTNGEIFILGPVSGNVIKSVGMVTAFASYIIAWEATIPAAAAPTASAVSISGTAQVGQVLTGNYTYADANGDPQGVSTFRWLRSGTAIAGATASNYTLVAADQGHTITFEVTPVATIAPTTGTPVVSSATAAVAAAPLPTGGGNGTLTVANAPASVGGSFVADWRLPQGNGADILLPPGNYVSIGWVEGGAAVGYIETVVLAFDLTTGQVAMVGFSSTNVTAPTGWAGGICYNTLPAALPAGVFPACSGVTVNRTAGTVNFANLGLVDSFASTITINGTLTFTPF